MIWRLLLLPLKAIKVHSVNLVCGCYCWQEAIKSTVRKSPLIRQRFWLFREDPSETVGALREA